MSCSGAQGSFLEVIAQHKSAYLDLAARKTSFNGRPQIYALLVCFALIFVILISAILSANNIVKFNFAASKIGGELIKFNSDDNYRFYLESRVPAIDVSKISLEELRKRRIFERESKIQAVRNEGLSGLSNSLTWLFFSSVFFMAHWFYFRRCKQRES